MTTRLFNQPAAQPQPPGRPNPQQPMAQPPVQQPVAQPIVQQPPVQQLNVNIKEDAPPLISGLPEMSPEQWKLLSIHQKLILLSLAMYNIIIDIPSIIESPKGWRIYGKGTPQEMLELIETDIRARTIAFVGQFNSGKSWLIGRFALVDLKPGQSINTIGISLVLPKRNKKQADQQNASVVPDPFANRIGGVYVPSTVAQPQAPSVQEESVDFAFIDTAGTSVPCHSSFLQDNRATEVLLRECIIHASNRVVYVASKFDRDTQVQLVQLINQINKIKHHTEGISGSNKLLVIHNYRDISNKHDLEVAIERVRATYDQPSSEDNNNNNNVSKHDFIGSSKRINHKPWEKIRSFDCDFYHSENTIHVFLVNENAPDADNWSPKAHNANIIQGVLKVFTNDQMSNIRLLPEIMEFAEKSLPKYLRDQTPRKLTFNKESMTIQVDPKPDVPFFQLGDIHFGDYGLVSSNEIQLERHNLYKGNVLVNRKDQKILIQVKIPGFTDLHRSKDYIRFNWSRKRDRVEVWAIILPPTLPPGFSLFVEGFRSGKGVFTAILPEDAPYEFPKPIDKLYTERMSIENGIVSINLDIDALPDEF